MDLLSQLLFCQSAYRMCDILSEGLIYLLFVEVYGRLGVLQMLDIVQHVKWIFQCHQEVIHLVQTMPVSDNLFKQKWVQGPMPVKEAASSGLSHNDLPTAHHFQLVVPILDLFEFSLIEHIRIYQAQAMLNDSLSEFVVATFVALDYVHHKLHHIILNISLLFFHCVYFLHASFNLPHDKLTSVAIYQDHPFVDQEFLCFELNFDSFQHFNCLDNDTECGFGHGCVVFLEQKQVQFETSLDFCGQLDAIGNLIRSNLEEIFIMKHDI